MSTHVIEGWAMYDDPWRESHEEPQDAYLDYIAKRRAAHEAVETTLVIEQPVQEKSSRRNSMIFAILFFAFFPISVVVAVAFVAGYWIAGVLAEAFCDLTGKETPAWADAGFAGRG